MSMNASAYETAVLAKMPYKTLTKRSVSQLCRYPKFLQWKQWLFGNSNASNKVYYKKWRSCVYCNTQPPGDV
eukprot:9545852-Ditylum_brightwellii.AAC.1